MTEHIIKYDGRRCTCHSVQFETTIRDELDFINRVKAGQAMIFYTTD